jgi:hypothetical protein
MWEFAYLDIVATDNTNIDTLFYIRPCNQWRSHCKKSKIKNYNIIVENVHFIGLYCITNRNLKPSGVGKSIVHEIAFEFWMRFRVTVKDFLLNRMTNF